MLTFEIKPTGNEIELHFDAAGARLLIDEIIRATEQQDHAHLMTLSWGTGELSEDAQGPGNRLVHHVTLMCWPSASEGTTEST